MSGPDLDTLVWGVKNGRINIRRSPISLADLDNPQEKLTLFAKHMDVTAASGRRSHKMCLNIVLLPSL